jgi:hypothetical protein
MTEEKRRKLIMTNRTHVLGETAMHPYYYYRNGMLHVKYTVDRCLRLSEAEINELKIKLTANPSDKQKVLADAWNFFAECVGKEVLKDGVIEVDKNIGKSHDRQ